MERTSRGIALTLAILAAIGVSLAAMLVALNRHDQTVGLDREIQYDDFAFSVLASRTATELGEMPPVKPQGVFCVLTLKIANHAKRVDFRYKPDSPVLIDERGLEYSRSVEGQAALDAMLGSDQSCLAPIPAGQSCVAQVVFDVPADAQISQFRLTVGGPVRDLLNDIFWGRKRISLGPAAAQASSE